MRTEADIREKINELKMEQEALSNKKVFYDVLDLTDYRFPISLLEWVVGDNEIHNIEESNNNGICTWEHDNTVFDALSPEHYHTGCGRVIYGDEFQDFIYCPFCGKKMELCKYTLDE